MEDVRFNGVVRENKQTGQRYMTIPKPIILEVGVEYEVLFKKKEDKK